MTVNPNHVAGPSAGPLKAKTSKTQFVLLGFLTLFFGPIALWGAFRAVTGGFAPVPTVISLMCLGCLGLVGFIFIRAHLRLPKLLDSDGITRQDGRKFGWGELVEVEHQYHTSKYSPGQKLIWRIEVRFSNGTVWLLPLKIVNFAEIYRFVSTLPCEHREKKSGSGFWG